MNEFKKFMLNRRRNLAHWVAVVLLIAFSPLIITSYANAADPVYDCGDYGAGEYSDNCAAGETIQGGDSGTNGGGILSGSGQRIALYSVLSVVCIGSAIYLLVKAKKSSSESNGKSPDTTQA